MPDFLLTDPDGSKFKVTVPDDVPRETAEQQIGHMIEHQQRWGMPAAEEQIPGIINTTIERTAAAPFIAAKHLGESATSGTLDPTDPQTAGEAFGLVGGLAGGRMPTAGAGEIGVAGGRGFTSPRQIRSHLDELNEAVRAGRMTPEQLAQARTRLGLPAESSVNRLSATSIGTRPVNQQTLGELRQAAPQTEEEWGRSWQTRAASADRFSVRPPAAPQSFSPLGHYGQEFYNEHIAPHFPDQAAFVQSYFSGAYNSRFNVEMTPEGHLRMEGPLVLDGKKFGTVDRIIDPDGRVAKHDYLRVDDKARGGGFVKQMTANQIDLYRKMGIEQVKLWANVDVGGYAWAKYGWLPSAQEWETAVWPLQTRFRSLYQHLDHSTQAYVNNLLNNPDPRSIWAISDTKTPWQHPDWDPKINTVGKAMLSGNNWHGTLLLGDEQQMARFNDYVSQGK